jgi:L-fuconate dehydratase
MSGAARVIAVDTYDIRWLGPEKGVMHMAIGAVVNAVWDLAANRAGVPLWKLLAVADGHYVTPTGPGFSAQMLATSIAAYTYPDGAFWAADRAAPTRRGPGA